MKPRITRAGGGLNAHQMVAETATEMANELFEVYARENTTYRALRAGGQVAPAQARAVFVQRMAPKLLEDARKALTDCLSLPDDRMPPAQKDKIAEALIKDSDLRANRRIATEIGAATVH